METRRSISGAVGPGVDLVGEEAGAEEALAGVVALAGAGKKAKAETRTVDEIMHSIPYD